ncbi:Z-ring associated ZapG family protein [Halomonas koreensis]|uniref:Z-ring associated protein G n=1 Tax=Halomonas koreensis TaxID=245385 RepID=A0ABU1G6Q1_9GAMM|nr:DUF1043 family protein [Halomonas koreensis]MDR5868381.1 DUF1043 family protein [Halomonas koreensis]
MEQSNINWMLAIACLLAGVGVGALGYHLLNAGARNAQRLRQRLAERDRQLTELRDGAGERLARLAELAEALGRDSQTLREEVAETTARLGGERPRGLDLTAADAEPKRDEDGVAAPRDYADGNRGTLSEDFGLKSSDADAPQPPRY